MKLNATVFVVEADESQRASLAWMIRRTGWAPETYGTAAEFLARPALLAPACLVLQLPRIDGDGLNLMRRITAERPMTPVIAVAGEGDVPTTVQAMRAGVMEFLVEPLGRAQLLAALGQALARSESMIQQDSELLEIRKRYEALSTREREVMSLVVAGFLNKQVGASLGISEITVKAHRGKLMRKMAADSLAALVVMALRLGLPPATIRREQLADH